MNRTLIYYTANLIPEPFAEKVRARLQSQADKYGLPIISVSQKPLNFGYNICVGDIGVCNYNVYWQLWQGVKLVETDCIVCCEDDAVYSDSHILHHPQSKDVFFYDWNRYIIDKDVFWHKDNRTVMSMCIASTKLMFDTLKEKFEKYPSKDTDKWKYFGEPGKYEGHLGLTIREKQFFTAPDPSITFNHKNNLGGRRKRYNTDPSASELPYWGKAIDLWKEFYG
jgi:hypothetical protein